jgi:poly(hydroxyalkanoate) depolymerase family esterase
MRRSAQKPGRELPILGRMSKRMRKSAWAKALQRQFLSMSRLAAAAGTRALASIVKPVVAKPAAPPEAGTWTPGVAMGTTGARRFRLYRPPGVKAGERLPLLVMLHGCGQDAEGFAASTRMNRVARRERFLVLYPEQDRLANAQGCWNWYQTQTGGADSEVELILQAIDQVCLLHPADRSRVAVAGLSAGASMAALLVERHPERFRALVMHSGIPPGTAHSGLTAMAAMGGRRPTLPLAAAPAARAGARPPLLVIHGDADAVVSPANGRAAVHVWAEAAGARAETPRTVSRGQRYPMTVTDFKCGGATVATLLVVHGLAHAWSGGAARQPFSDARGPDASRLVWAFAAKQFRGSVGERAAAAPRRSPAASPARMPPEAA